MDFIKILRQHLILCKRLSELLDKLRTDLKESTSGQGLSTTTQAIEPVMLELSKSENAINELLQKSKTQNLQSFIEAQPESVEREVAFKLLKQIAQFQSSIRHKIVNSATLLVNSRSFIEYNMNVMSQTAAPTTYGNPKSESSPRRHIFSANV